MTGNADVNTWLVARTKGRLRWSSSFRGLVYRTGPYAPNGIPIADAYADYLPMCEMAASMVSRSPMKHASLA
jgi:hypothetical protein